MRSGILTMDDDFTLTVRVECHAGYRGEETPRRFYIRGTPLERCVDVVEVLDRWLAPDHRYFKVLGNDGDTYILRHDAAADRWEMTMFRRGLSGSSNR